MKKQRKTKSDTRCGLCWNEKFFAENPEEDFGTLPNKVILEEFNLCKKHKEEMEMAQCAKCGNQDMEYKSGVSKSTGKKWQGWKCVPCDLMHGMNGIPWGDNGSSPKASQFAPNQAKSGISAPINNDLIQINKKLDQILEILHENFGQNPETIVKDDESPF